MLNFSCLLSGLVRLLGTPLLLIFRYKKTRARLYPAVAAILACFPAFMIGAVIRSGFDRSSVVSYYVQQGLLYGFLEEGTKYLMLRYHLTSYDNRKDAVTYGIGHSGFEEIGAGFACINLIGTGRAANDILLFSIFGFAEGTAWVIALTVIVFYGIRTERSGIVLPAAMLMHAFGNMTTGLFCSLPLSLLLTTVYCYIAFRCWRSMKSPFEDEV